MIKNIKVVNYTTGSTTASAPPIDLTNEDFIGFQNSNDTVALTIYGSTDGTNYGTVFLNNTVITVATTVAYSNYLYDSIVLKGIKYIKAVKATTATTVTLKLITDVK